MCHDDSSRYRVTSEGYPTGLHHLVPGGVMTEKYIDLAGIIWEDTQCPSLTTGFGKGVNYALRWLDEHPDQVPGRTITESQIAEAFGDEYHYWAKRRLSRIGITVVPDPEPTNLERLKEIQNDWLRESRNGELFIEYLDRMGVRAPEGGNQ